MNADRFWSHVNKSGECWIWTASMHGKIAKYGQATGISGRVHLAHRVAWEIANGPIPPGLYVLHRCDNPPCVRPDHLFLGTHADNMADRQAKGRTAAGERSGARRHPERHPRGTSHPMARLNEDRVRSIRERIERGELHREIAVSFGVSNGTISDIACRKTWAHVQ